MKKLETFTTIAILIAIIWIFYNCSLLLSGIDRLETTHQTKIDSLQKVIIEKEEEIKILEESCQIKESEISYWGQKYNKCKNK